MLGQEWVITSHSLYGCDYLSMTKLERHAIIEVNTRLSKYIT